MKKNMYSMAALLAVALVLTAEPSWAGQGGTAFQPVWDVLTEWTTGTLGKIVSGAMILVGMVGGVARQSLMSFAIGIGGGVGLYHAPNVIDSIVSATIPIAGASTAAATAALTAMM